MQDLKIWVSYHDESLYDEFKLGELDKNIFIPHNLSKECNEENINHLQKYWAEICSMYYVWKNQKKSDFVGFCSYRRLFNNIVDIDNNECLYIIRQEKEDTIFNLYCQEHYKGDIIDALSYIKNNGYDNEYNKIMNSNEHIFNNCFIMSWVNFNKLCEFLFGTLFYLDELYELHLNGDNYVKRYYNIFDEYNLKYTKDYQTRGFAFLAERLIGTWITCNTDYKCVQNEVYIIDGTPHIVFERNSGVIDINKNKEIINSTISDILSNSDLYKLKIFCDKTEPDVIELSLKRKSSLIKLLSENNIPENRYIIKLGGYSSHYNNNSCIVVIRKHK